MARCASLLALGVFFVALCRPVDGCSLCPMMIKKDTLGQEIDRAKIVLYGFIANSDIVASTTDFHIEQTIKRDPFLDGVKTIKLERYLPIPDAKDPPRYLLFCDVFKDKLDPYHGRALNSGKTLLDYVNSARPMRGKDRVEALLFYAKFLDHSDPAVAEDAFLEFAKSNDQDVGQAAKRLSPERFRNLMNHAKTDPDRLGLYAFLLGASGSAKDAAFLRRWIDRPSPEQKKALDGLLCGYVTLEPQEGWKLASALAADSKQDFNTRFAIVRATRFLYNWKPKEHRTDVVRLLKGMLPDPEVADLAVEDLRRWRIWDLTADVLACYRKKGYDAPIIERTIVRYALNCPLPAARDFVERIRKIDPEMIDELREALAFESGK